MSIFNLAYSAPRGYDIRAPYNVPMGEIQALRVVDPFSPSAYQKDTITTALPRASCNIGPAFSLLRVIRCKQRNSQRCRRTGTKSSKGSTSASGTTTSKGTSSKNASKVKVKKDEVMDISEPSLETQLTE